MFPEIVFPNTEFLPPELILKREGAIGQLGDTVLLDEFVTASEITGAFEWITTDSIEPPNPTGGVAIERFEGKAGLRVPIDETERYQAHPLPPTVSINIIPQGVSVSGLREIAELEYPYEFIRAYSHVEIGGTVFEPLTDTNNNLDPVDSLRAIPGAM